MSYRIADAVKTRIDAPEGNNGALFVAIATLSVLAVFPLIGPGLGANLHLVAHALPVLAAGLAAV